VIVTVKEVPAMRETVHGPLTTGSMGNLGETMSITLARAE
jgi:hypothetical protein